MADVVVERPMSVLVTGGAGFIGSNFVSLLEHGHHGIRARVLDDFSTGLRQNLAGSAADVVEASLLDDSALREAMDGVDSVVHLGALGSVPRSIANPVATHFANVQGTFAVLEAARDLGVGQVIVASSSSVYGSNPRLPKTEDDWTRPLSPYAASKLASEAYALAYGHNYDMKTLPLRFFNVYGPRQRADHVYAAVIPRFVDAALNGRPIVVHGDGSQSRDFTFVETVCRVLLDAVVRVVESPAPVNVAFGSSTTVNELVRQLTGLLGRELPVEYVDPRPGDVAASQADGVRVRQLFPGIEPVDIADGLERTIDWFLRE